MDTIFQKIFVSKLKILLYAQIRIDDSVYYTDNMTADKVLSGA